MTRSLLSKTSTRKQFLATLALLSAGLAGPAFAQADYPNKPVRLVVPFSPGGGSDTSARLLGTALGAKLGQPVIIDNKPGAAGAIGAETVARAKPDGLTLLVGNIGTQSINPILYKKLPYDAKASFTPVSLYAELPQVLLVNPSVPAKDLKELVALLKQQPGKLSYSTSGAGSSMHLAAEMFKNATSTDVVHVPYRGGGPAIADLIAGHVQLSFATVLESIGHIRSGKLRAIAVTGDKRVPALADVPAIAETIPGFNSISWVGVLAPAGTPKAVVDQLAAAIRDAVAGKDVSSRLTEQGAVPHTTTSAQFAQLIETDYQRYAKLIGEKNITAD